MPQGKSRRPTEKEECGLELLGGRGRSPGLGTSKIPGSSSCVEGDISLQSRNCGSRTGSAGRAEMLVGAHTVMTETETVTYMDVELRSPAGCRY